MKEITFLPGNLGLVITDFKIVQVLPNSQGAEKGVQTGWTIVQINGEKEFKNNLDVDNAIKKTNDAGEPTVIVFKEFMKKVIFEPGFVGMECTGWTVSKLIPGGQAEQKGVGIGWKIVQLDDVKIEQSGKSRKHSLGENLRESIVVFFEEAEKNKPLSDPEFLKDIMNDAAMTQNEVKDILGNVKLQQMHGAHISIPGKTKGIHIVFTPNTQYTAAQLKAKTLQLCNMNEKYVKYHLWHNSICLPDDAPCYSVLQERVIELELRAERDGPPHFLLHRSKTLPLKLKKYYNYPITFLKQEHTHRGLLCSNKKHRSEEGKLKAQLAIDLMSHDSGGIVLVKERQKLLNGIRLNFLHMKSEPTRRKKEVIKQSNKICQTKKKTEQHLTMKLMKKKKSEATNIVVNIFEKNEVALFKLAAEKRTKFIREHLTKENTLTSKASIDMDSCIEIAAEHKTTEDVAEEIYSKIEIVSKDSGLVLALSSLTQAKTSCVVRHLSNKLPTSIIWCLDTFLHCLTALVLSKSPHNIEDKNIIRCLIDKLKVGEKKKELGVGKRKYYTYIEEGESNVNLSTFAHKKVTKEQALTIRNVSHKFILDFINKTLLTSIKKGEKVLLVGPHTMLPYIKTNYQFHLKMDLKYLGKFEIATDMIQHSLGKLEKKQRTRIISPEAIKKELMNALKDIVLEQAHYERMREYQIKVVTQDMPDKWKPVGNDIDLSHKFLNQAGEVSLSFAIQQIKSHEVVTPQEFYVRSDRLGQYFKVNIYSECSINPCEDIDNVDMNPQKKVRDFKRSQTSPVFGYTNFFLKNNPSVSFSAITTSTSTMTITGMTTAIPTIIATTTTTTTRSIMGLQFSNGSYTCPGFKPEQWNKHRCQNCVRDIKMH